jgi:hypothetical protein
MFPISFDEDRGEWWLHLSDGITSGKAVIRFCPFCGSEIGNESAAMSSNETEKSLAVFERLTKCASIEEVIAITGEPKSCIELDGGYVQYNFDDVLGLARLFVVTLNGQCKSYAFAPKQQS